ncbi:MAG: SHOCT domain-containing protein [Jatrophihabitantaceae bacterium]
MMAHGAWSGTGWLLMGIGMLLFWTLVAIVVLWLAGVFGPAGRGRSSRSDRSIASLAGSDVLDAQAILDRRLASGDLSEDEYRARRDLLGSR